MSYKHFQQVEGEKLYQIWVNDKTGFINKTGEVVTRRFTICYGG